MRKEPPVATFGQTVEKKQKPASKVVAWFLRVGLAVLIPVIAFFFLYQGFLFLRAGNAPKWVIALVAIIWGVGGVAILYYIFNKLVRRFLLRDRKTPTICCRTSHRHDDLVPVPGTAPTISLFGRNGPPALPVTMIFTNPGEYFTVVAAQFVGLSNYAAVFTDRLMLGALRNNIIFWIGIATPLTVIVGLLVAVLADRSKFERIAKSTIFMPMAISFVGAGVIWNFIYEVNPPGTPQIGLLNAVVVAFGGQPHGWTNYTAIAPWNNLFLVIIVVWLQTGYAMVLFSAAIKGIPEEIIEAARVDGATEIQVFFRIMIPHILGTIITVTTTIIIFTLKIFDVVWVMTGGQFGTDVIATQFYRQSFINRNSGYGSAIAIVLLLAITPVILYNLRQLREQETFR
jgi:alpha-glucoside transport system permease protein